ERRRIEEWFLSSSDGVLIASYSWNGELITIEIDGLSVGSYIFTLQVYDTNMNTASDTVMVTVRPESTTSATITTTNTTNTAGNAEFIQQVSLVISIGSTLVIVIVGVAACRSRKGAV
ncbi:MAG: hypothetical protein ThorAB25_27490, partial [Candidatus Thorarchaeota archaeon AB_25]